MAGAVAQLTLAFGSPEVWAACIAAAGGILAALVPVSQVVARNRRERRASTRNHQIILPSRVGLVDRTNEVSTVLRHLQRGEFLIAIEGAIGSGKSAIAAEVAHRLADRVGSPSGGPMSRIGRRYQWLAWIDAHNSCPSIAEVGNQLSLLTGEQSLATAPEEDKEAVLRSFLARSPSILVIDNVKLTASGAQEFSRFMRTLPSGSIAIISSNTPGRLNAPRILVEELQLGFMRELLMREAERIGAQSILNADEETIGKVYRIIGGNPQAVELFVQVCSRPPATLSGVIEQISSGDGPVLRELFSAVWEGLSGEDRLVVVACSLLESESLLEHVEAALEVSPELLRRRIEYLWSDGLITRRQQGDEAYYSVTPIMRGFALKQAPDTTVEEIRKHLARHLTLKYQEDWEDAEGALPHISATRQLVEQLGRSNELELCLDLFEASLDIFFTLGLFDDRIRLGWIAYEAATALGDPERASLALSVVSSTHSLRGEHEQADHAIDLGMGIATAAGSTRERARQIRCKAYNVFRSGDAEQALRITDGVDTMALEADDLNNFVDIVALRSAAQWHLGRLEECRSTVDVFLHYCRAIPWERAIAYPVREKAELSMMDRSFRDADVLLRESREIAQKYRDERQLVRIALSEVRLHLFRGRPARAWRHGTGVVRNAQRLGLLSEREEARAVVVTSQRATFLPWRWVSKFVTPIPRFTEMTIGGD
ncbi:ATP-binding protein [Streptomyces sp. KMM 9044]|uniref:ATP-binding protein n=1 Tax=Streptomyces sp. KMM 9044 TaxID=2744474 RepID=UPI002172301A|nr:ATP-binding protein [Streptomyces sp. KMM 9044]WAX78121.1 ATP-binding protein [Streptomyces sp. KMM 9044]